MVVRKNTAQLKACIISHSPNGLLLGKYRTLFYNEIGNNDILYCLIFSTVSLDEEEETNEDDLTEELKNDIINDVIKEDKEELIKLDNELKHLSSNVLV